MNKFTSAFNEITASEKIKDNTKSFIYSKIKSSVNKKNKRLRYVAAACSFVILALISIAGYVMYSSPVSTISIDVNPSIELSLNVFNNVVSAKAFNDDGMEIVQNIDVSNMEYTQAVDKILNDEIFMKYINDDSLLVITVASERKSEIIENIQSQPVVAKYNAEMQEADSEVVEQAHSCGFSFGKYQAYLELKSIDPTVTEEEVKAMTMREIRDRIEEKSNVDSTQTDNEWSGNGKNQGNGNRGNGHGKGGKSHGKGKNNQ